jgi:hypothetical protein
MTNAGTIPEAVLSAQSGQQWRWPQPYDLPVDSA